MRVAWIAVSLSVMVCMSEARAQGISDLFEGRLVKPAVGQWAWYELTDASGGNKHVVRQAVVGQEKVAGQVGYWVEFELVPQVGFKTIYKMLVTGPANEAKNVHRIFVKRGPGPVEAIPVSTVFEKNEPKAPEARQPVGKDEIPLAQGSVKADHYTVTAGKEPLDIWVNEEVPPTGIVRVKSAGGQMVLRSYGTGGKDGQSAMAESEKSQDTKVSVKVEKGGSSPKAEKGGSAQTKKGASK